MKMCGHLHAPGNVAGTHWVGPKPVLSYMTPWVAREYDHEYRGTRNQGWLCYLLLLPEIEPQLLIMLYFSILLHCIDLTMMADQHTTKLMPRQEHSRQPQPANTTQPKATTCTPHNKNTQRQQQQEERKPHYSEQQHPCPQHLHTWRWPVRPKHIVK
jgi:hypothetical protein